MEELNKHIHECISRNISKELRFENVDIRDTSKLATFMASNLENREIAKRMQKNLADTILGSFSLQSLLEPSNI